MNKAAVSGWIPPSKFEEYRLLRPLGAGGMGQVYLAHDQLLDRTVAIKFIGAYEPDADARARFLIEGRAAARLAHPNVVTVYRVGEIDGRPYIVSEYVRGQTLAEIDLPVAPAKVLEMGIQLARGLASAHRQGVFHRDIKPGNAVMTEDGIIKLLDFGLAKLLHLTAPQSEETRTSHPFRPVVTPAPAAHDRTAPMPIIPLASLDAPERPSPAAGRVSAVMGTPHYMAPEVWRNSPSTPRADVYALGAVLYELCSGAPPHASDEPITLSELSSLVQDVAVPPIASIVADLDPRLGEVIDRCLRRAPEERFASGEELREALEQLALGPAHRAAADVEPYPGLAAFESDRQALFFGRGGDTRAIVERLRGTGLVLVAGDSGIGKSSLCRAGVLPAIVDGALGDRRTWQTIAVTIGPRPVAALGAALAPLLGREEDAVAGLLREDLRTILRELRAALRDKRGLVFLFDQLEELVTLASPADAAAIAELLRELGHGIPGLRALATVRGDFLTRVAGLPGLAEDTARALYLLGPLSSSGIRQAIEGPALARGVRFESPALVDELVAATSADAGGLPLLQFALAELWQARDLKRHLITHAALTDIGGVTGALARHADLVIAGMVPALRPAARRVILRLVTPEGTRARLALEDLIGGDADDEAALAALVSGRLVLARDAAFGERDVGSTYELAHEALLTGWDTLRRWLSEKAGSRVIVRRIELAAAEWERLGGAADALWGQRQLGEVDTIDPQALEPRERRFLDRSRARARMLRWLRLGVLVAGPFLIATIWGGVELANRAQRARADAAAAREIRAKVEGRLAEARRLADRAAGHDASARKLGATAMVAFDGRRPADGEEAWSRARDASGAADRAWIQAEHVLEQANNIDPGRADVKAAFADVIAARAEAARRERRQAAFEDLLARLATFDEGGPRLARFNAPATLTLTLRPPGSLISIARYVAAGDRLALEPLATPGAGPIELPQGSYLVTAAAEGRATTRFPVLLDPGEQVRVAFELPRLAEMPRDFIYVPPGRFLRGSGDDEGLRKSFLRATPLHQADGKGFLIARHETTYADWIAFLEALPPAARAARTPRVQTSVGDRGSLALERAPDGVYRLSIAASDQRLVARAGTPLRYAGRSTGATQDWLRAPVSGISFEDARAYVAWLADSKRVPRARMCSEIEWERAARGADGRPYPNGDVLAPVDGNFDATYGRTPQAFGPDEVGAHPDGVSPFGLLDVTGNVWELTTSADVEGEVVAKGGSFYTDALSGHAANRELPEATFRDITVGLRVCAD